MVRLINGAAVGPVELNIAAIALTQEADTIRLLPNVPESHVARFVF